METERVVIYSADEAKCGNRKKYSTMVVIFL